MYQTHLGAEYYSIAKSVYEGRGFSDPFEDRTGPTGWMPPLLVYLMAGILMIVGGSKEWLTLIFLVMNASILAFTGAICLTMARQIQAGRLALVEIGLVLCTRFKWCFQLTHDVVFLMFWIDVVILGLWKWRVPSKRFIEKTAWGFIGGLAALSGPPLGLPGRLALRSYGVFASGKLLHTLR